MAVEDTVIAVWRELDNARGEPRQLMLLGWASARLTSAQVGSNHAHWKLLCACTRSSAASAVMCAAMARALGLLQHGACISLGLQITMQSDLGGHIAVSCDTG